MENEIIRQWDRAADTYTEMQEKSEFVRINKQVVAARFRDLSGQRVLDLGCGYGWYVDFFSSLGARATGCDGSERMVELAKQRYPQCQFTCADITKALPYESGRFDLVFCNQVLMDIPDIAGPIRDAYRVLKPGGIFYVSIVHPAFYDCAWEKDETGFRNAKIMTQYLSEYRFDNEFWGKTAHYHRTISTYLNTAADQGFRLVHLEEPVSYDGITKSQEFPLFLFAEFVKA